jgi:hypothetical protein
MWKNAIRPDSKPKTERSVDVLVNTSSSYSYCSTVGHANAASGFPFYDHVCLVCTHLVGLFGWEIGASQGLYIAFCKSFTQLGRKRLTNQTYFMSYTYFLYAKSFLKNLLCSIGILRDATIRPTTLKINYGVMFQTQHLETPCDANTCAPNHSRFQCITYNRQID